MPVLNVQKVNTLPGTLDSNACYIVKSATPGLVNLIQYLIRMLVLLIQQHQLIKI